MEGQRNWHESLSKEGFRAEMLESANRVKKEIAFQYIEEKFSKMLVELQKDINSTAIDSDPNIDYKRKLKREAFELVSRSMDLLIEYVLELGVKPKVDEESAEEDLDPYPI